MLRPGVLPRVSCLAPPLLAEEAAMPDASAAIDLSREDLLAV